MQSVSFEGSMQMGIWAACMAGGRGQGRLYMLLQESRGEMQNATGRCC